MKTLLLIIALLAFQTAQLKLNDLDGLIGKKWTGNLTYLDYGTGRLEAIETELTVAIKSPGIYSWVTAYPKESSHNSTEEVVISADGHSIDGETVTERTVLPNGSLKFVTQKTGEDNNKKAKFRYTYLIGKKGFSRNKEVCYEGETTWFTRNTLSLTAN